MKHIISTLVQNKPGVLAHVARVVFGLDRLRGGGCGADRLLGHRTGTDNLAASRRMYRSIRAAVARSCAPV